MEKICGTPITREEFEKGLCKGLQTSKKIRDLNGEIIAAGQGYLSCIVKVGVEWDDGSKGSYIMKAPKIDNFNALLEKFEGVDMSVMAALFPKLHKTECNAYEFLKSDPPCSFPKIFYAKEAGPDHPGMIIMEDLTGTAGTVPLMRGLNLEQVLQVTESLAQLHSWCLKNDHWRGHFSEVKPFIEMYPSFEPAIRSGIPKTKQMFSEQLGHLDLEKILTFMSFEKIKEVDRNHLGIMPSVIVHGDFWSNNILFEKLPDGSIGNRPVAFIDWQVAHEGNPMEDFGRLLSTSCHSSVLESHLGTIAQRYHEVLKAGAGEKFTASLETVQRIMEQTVALQAFFIPGSLPIAIAEFGKDYPNKKEGEEEIIRRAIAGHHLALRVLF